MELASGLALSCDYPMLEPSGVAGFGENHAFGVFDAQGRFHLHFHIQPIPGMWQVRRTSGAIALPAGRMLMFQGEGASTTERNVGSGSVNFECREPFARWIGTFRGTARDTTDDAIAAGPLIDGSRCLVEVELDLTMGVPAWVLGTMNPRKVAGGQDAKTFLGGFRYEQLFRAQAKLRVDDQEHVFSGTGYRTHRQGVRDTSGMHGHSAQTALFPSGQAFGIMRFRQPDGTAGFSEAFVYRDHEMLPAQVLEAPWLPSLTSRGESSLLVLETDRGRETIECLSLAMNWRTLPGVGHDLAWHRLGNHGGGQILVGSGMGRYRWAGEDSCGLLEGSGRVGVNTS